MLKKKKKRLLAPNHEHLFKSQQMIEVPRPQPTFTTFGHKNEMRNDKVMPIAIQNEDPIYLLLTAIIQSFPYHYIPEKVI